MPRIYEKKEKRSLASGLRTQIQSRKKKNAKIRTFGNEVLSKKSRLKNSELILKKNKFQEKQSRSFRRKKSQDGLDLKNSFQNSNESFYQKKNQSLVGKKQPRVVLDTVSLDKKTRTEVQEDAQGNRFIPLTKLDKVSENEEENIKCRSQESRRRRERGSRSLSSEEQGRLNNRSRSQEVKQTPSHIRLNTGLGLKRSTGGKLFKMCIYAKNPSGKPGRSRDEKSEKNRGVTLMSKALDREQLDSEEEGTKFFTLNGKARCMSPSSKFIDEELKLLYHKRKQNQVHCHSLNTSQKQITSRASGAIESGKALLSKVTSFEEPNYPRGGKMTTSLAMMKKSKNGKLVASKNYSMFQERKLEHRLPSNLNTPRVSKHDLIRNLYQPGLEPKKHTQSHVHEFSWPLAPAHKSREKKRMLLQTSKDPAKFRREGLKNSKKRQNDSSMKLTGVDNVFKKKREAPKKTVNSTKQKKRVNKLKQSKRMEQHDVRREVMKDHQFQREHMQKIIKNFRDSRPEKKKKRVSYSEQPIFESKFQMKKARRPVDSSNSKMAVSREQHEPSSSFQGEGLQESSVIESQKFESNQSKKRGDSQEAPAKPKKYKTSVQKEAKNSNYSQREIIVPRDFRIFNNKVRSGEGLELPRNYGRPEPKKTATESKPSYRVGKKGVFQGVNEKFKNLHEGINEKMDQKMNQILNRRTVWRDKLINNPVSCIRKNQGLKYTKSKKKLFSKPAIKMIVGKVKQSFLNKDRPEPELTGTNKKGLREPPADSGEARNKKTPSALQNKPEVPRQKTMVKNKSIMKLDRMLKNRNFNQKAKTKINLSNQFKVLKKPVGKEHFNKEEELKNDQKKFLADFNILHLLGKGSYAQVHMAYDLGKRPPNSSQQPRRGNQDVRALQAPRRNPVRKPGERAAHFEAARPQEHHPAVRPHPGRAHGVSGHGERPQADAQRLREELPPPEDRRVRGQDHLQPRAGGRRLSPRHRHHPPGPEDAEHLDQREHGSQADRLWLCSLL